MCARGAQQQAAEQDIRQAEEIGRVRLIRHSLNCIYFSLPGKGGDFLRCVSFHNASA
jgi:hypothetical protein